MFNIKYFDVVKAIIFCLLAFAIDNLKAIKVHNIVPNFCGSAIDSGPRLKEIQLKSAGNESFLSVGASILQGIEIVPNYKCFFIVQSPKGTGMVLTVRKASLNDKDLIAFRSGTNPERVWKQNAGEDLGLQYEEIVSLASKDYESAISVKYEPTVGVSPFNAGFDLTFTVYKEKIGNTCGEDFDCQNDRCVSSVVQCDGLNNCGNNQDESACSAISWWIVAILVAIAVIVVLLAILVWVRMSRA